MSHSVDVTALLERPQDEHDLVAALRPEHPMLFAHARRLLSNTTRNGAGRFQVGRIAPGRRSVILGETGWVAVRPADGTGWNTATFDDARSAVACAVAGLMCEERVGVNSRLLEIAGVLKSVLVPQDDGRTRRSEWRPHTVGVEIQERFQDASGPTATTVTGDGAYLGLEALLASPPGYFNAVPGPPPEDGPYVSVHEVFEHFVRNSLPDPVEPENTGGDGAVSLPEGTELDAYGDTDQVIAYEPGTPFSKRALWGSAEDHAYHRYRVLRPLRTYPCLWFRTSVLPAGAEASAAPGGSGRGHFLVDSIDTLVADGHLAEVSAPGKGHGRVRWH